MSDLEKNSTDIIVKDSQEKPVENGKLLSKAQSLDQLEDNAIFNDKKTAQNLSYASEFDDEFPDIWTQEALNELPCVKKKPDTFSCLNLSADAFNQDYFASGQVNPRFSAGQESSIAIDDSHANDPQIEIGQTPQIVDLNSDKTDFSAPKVQSDARKSSKKSYSTGNLSIFNHFDASGSMIPLNGVFVNQASGLSSDKSKHAVLVEDSANMPAKPRLSAHNDKSSNPQKLVPNTSSFVQALGSDKASYLFSSMLKQKPINFDVGKSTVSNQISCFGQSLLGESKDFFIPTGELKGRTLSLPSKDSQSSNQNQAGMNSGQHISKDQDTYEAPRTINTVLCNDTISSDQKDKVDAAINRLKAENVKQKNHGTKKLMQILNSPIVNKKRKLVDIERNCDESRIRIGNLDDSSDNECMNRSNLASNPSSTQDDKALNNGAKKMCINLETMFKAFKIGENVWCRKEDGFFYESKVVKLTGLNYTVQFDSESVKTVSDDQIYPYLLDIGDTCTYLKPRQNTDQFTFVPSVVIGKIDTRFLLISPENISQERNHHMWFSEKTSIVLSHADLERRQLKERMLVIGDDSKDYQVSVANLENDESCKENITLKNSSQPINANKVISPKKAPLKSQSTPSKNCKTPSVAPNLEKPEKLFNGVQFMITSISDHGDIEQEIRRHGGKTIPTESIEKIGSKRNDAKIYLVSIEPCRTVKYFMALAEGIPRVSVNWIFDCISAEMLLDIDSYLLPNGYFNCNTKVDYKNEPNCLDDIQLYLHYPPANERELWAKIIQLAGGQVSTKKSANFDYVLTFKEKLTERYKNSVDKPIVSKEWLFQCLINQQLLPIDEFLLHAPADNPKCLDKSSCINQKTEFSKEFNSKKTRSKRQKSRINPQ